MKYIEPKIEVCLFREGIYASEEAVAAASGVTSAQDVSNQLQAVFLKKGMSGSVATVKLQSIIEYQK